MYPGATEILLLTRPYTKSPLYDDARLLYCFAVEFHHRLLTHPNLIITVKLLTVIDASCPRK